MGIHFIKNINKRGFIVKAMAEYIWIDGYKPTANLRSKTKILDVSLYIYIKKVRGAGVALVGRAAAGIFGGC